MATSARLLPVAPTALITVLRDRVAMPARATADTAGSRCLPVPQPRAYDC